MATALAKQSFKLEQCLERVVDNRGKTPPLSESGIELLEVNAITDGRKSPAFENVRKYVSEETYATWFRSGHPRRGDTLISTVGAIGRVAFVNEERGCIAQNVVALRAKPSVLDGEFLYYYLASTDTQNRLLSLNIGVAQPSLKVPHLLSLAVELPPLPVQRRIAGILSAYDELMENSQRRIRLLEAMARALYREWFFHFRFPGHEKLPRVASPLGDIPQGWEFLPIKKLAKVVLGGTPSRSVNEYWDGGTIPWLKSGKVNDIRVIEGTEAITRRGLEMSSTKLMPPKTVLVAITGAILVSFLEIEACANQSVIGIYETRQVCPEYLHIYLTENISLFESKMSGSAQQHINKDIVEQTLVLVPHEEIAAAFRNFVQPLYEEVAALLFTIENLRRTRDLLLPRLLSGRVNLT